ncbi:HOL1 [Fusarium pseudocircinatum]|uniref:HOL1 n=1 Tax=Fusarium pseudocircinatum TaxID=56676 RepID=A0A8H5PKZ0_9HYPO|nr:HOL1 [Fusarium pseudocircinatum]
MAEMGCDLDMLLVLQLLILPVALAYDRRPVFLVSTNILLAATIGSAAQNSYNGHLASRVMQGLATGASESLIPLMLTEVTFLHERGRIFGLYWTVQNVLSSTMGLTSSYEAAALGWRWCSWVFAILVGVGLVLAFLFGFETRFQRPVTNLLMPVAILGFSRLILYGFMATAASGGGGSYWGILVSWTLFQVTFTSVLIVTTIFAAEASPKHPGPALVMVIGTKNIVSFGVAYGLTDMVQHGGYTWTFRVLAGIFGAIFILGIPIYMLNPKWRRYITRVEEKKGITITD